MFVNLQLNSIGRKISKLPSRNVLCSIILASFALIARIAYALDPERAVEPAKREPCALFAVDLEQHPFLSLDHLCVATGEFDETAAIYKRRLGGKDYRFLVLAQGLVLLVDRQTWQDLENSAAQREELLRQVPVDLLTLWWDDARHWQQWFEHMDDAWSGPGDRRRKSSS
jgi:hypothetical protein